MVGKQQVEFDGWRGSVAIEDLVPACTWRLCYFHEAKLSTSSPFALELRVLMLACLWRCVARDGCKCWPSHSRQRNYLVRRGVDRQRAVKEIEPHERQMIQEAVGYRRKNRTRRSFLDENIHTSMSSFQSSAHFRAVVIETGHGFLPE